MVVVVDVSGIYIAVLPGKGDDMVGIPLDKALLDVRLAVQQQLHYVDVSLLAGEHEGGEAVVGGLVDARTPHEEELNHHLMPVIRCDM